MQHIVNISDYAISTSKEDVVVTYSLGSCLGVVVVDPVLHVGGMIHCLLGYASQMPEKAAKTPAMFVTTGVPLLFKELIKKGAKRSNLIVKVAGGAHMKGVTDLFDTGQRNYEAFTKLLRKNNIPVAGSDVGGSIPRTMFLYMDTGRVTVKSYGKEQEI